MRIAIVSDPTKRELMQNFCLAYKLLLKKHELYATQQTAIRMEEATGLTFHKYLPADLGGADQLLIQIERNEIDAVFYFYTPRSRISDPNQHELLFTKVSHVCDAYCIPLATNIATAEALILGIAAGDLDWRS